MTRKDLPARREHHMQKVKIGDGRRTLYLSVDSTDTPSEVFLRISGDTDAEKVCLYDVLARLISLALQEGVSLAKVADRLHGTRSEPAGVVTGDDRISFCDGTLDFVGRHFLVHYCQRDDLAHKPKKSEA